MDTRDTSTRERMLQIWHALLLSQGILEYLQKIKTENYKLEKEFMLKTKGYSEPCQIYKMEVFLLVQIKAFSC